MKQKEMREMNNENQINGNEAAFEAIIDKIDEWHANGEMEHWQYSELFDIADNALASPSRNCDCHLAITAGVSENITWNMPS